MSTLPTLIRQIEINKISAEFVGYVGRVLSHYNQWILSRYILQAATLLVAPALFAASIYMMLGKIIVLVKGQKYSLLRMFWLTKLFVMGDILSFVTQGSGMLHRNTNKMLCSQ